MLVEAQKLPAETLMAVVFLFHQPLHLHRRELQPPQEAASASSPVSPAFRRRSDCRRGDGRLLAIPRAQREARAL